jgi:hypothetical protein
MRIAMALGWIVAGIAFDAAAQEPAPPTGCFEITYAFDDATEAWTHTLCVAHAPKRCSLSFRGNPGARLDVLECRVDHVVFMLDEGAGAYRELNYLHFDNGDQISGWAFDSKQRHSQVVGSRVPDKLDATKQKPSR